MLPPMFKRFLLLLGWLCFLPAGHGGNALLELKPHERIAFVGGSLAERMSLYGNFETLLHARFPEAELVVRNFGWPADEVGQRQRPYDYTKLDDPLAVFGPETFICFFGGNEAFAGPAGLERFKTNYAAFMAEYAQRYGPEGRARFVLISPVAFESTGQPFQPDGKRENENLKRYTEAIREIAQAQNLAFVDLFTPTLKEFSAKRGAQFTINGLHLNEAGDELTGRLLDHELFGGKSPRPAALKKMRAAVNDKSWVHQQDYRMLNGWYVYGTRSAPFDTETFPDEYKKVRAMVAARDRYVWNLAQGRSVPPQPDDHETGTLLPPKTGFGSKPKAEPPELRYLTGAESLAAMTPAPGFEVSLFASEEQFPELANPVQIAFDNRGRLWVLCMPTYPQWRPGDPRPSDRLLIFEDTNGDGRADKCKVFYDQLHCPTGFEFGDGGVYVVSQPRVLFLKDTNGDDRADVVVPWSDGWATEDTHHCIGAWEWSNGGLLHMLEGMNVTTGVETPWGPFRNKGTPGCYVLDPQSLRLRHYITPGYGNPWCYVFDEWGQGVVGDGTTAQQHWDSPLSSAPTAQRRGLNPIFNNESMRPAIGSEFLRSRHFPDDVQGQFIYACVLNMNGLPRFEIRDDGAGYHGQRITNLLASTDRSFRPADPQIGPDGALWFADWYNPLIGHMQYSQRDPSRDHKHGRIYRLTATGRPLLKPVTQFGKSIPALLEQLREYEPRTRDRARRELRARKPSAVAAAVKTWVAKLDPQASAYDRLLCEALWVQQGHHAVDPALLGKALAAKTPEARAAATRVVADEFAYLPGAMQLLAGRVHDDHPRVRLEAVRALSFVPTREAVELVLATVPQPRDYWLDYTIQHALGALTPVWKEPLARGEIARDNPTGLKYLTRYASGQPAVEQVQRLLRGLLDPGDLSAKQRREAISELATAQGKAAGGRELFERICVACHRIGDEGAELGPDLSQVGGRLTREELIESVIFPNAKVDPKYLATNITTKDGEEYSGLVQEENPQTLTLTIGSGQKKVLPVSNIAKRQSLKMSSMPEGLPQGMAAQEFVDLIEYLAGLK